MLVKDRGLGVADVGDIVSSLVNVGGTIGITAIQSNLAKNLARRQAATAIERDKIESQRQLALLQAQTASVEAQILQEATADALRAQARAAASSVVTAARGGFVAQTGSYWLAGAVLVGALLLLMRRRS